MAARTKKPSKRRVSQRPKPRPSETLAAEDVQGLSVSQVRALEALVAGCTIRDAAKAAGCSERAVHYWLRRVEFVAVLDDLKLAALTRAKVRAAILADRALDVIDEAMGAVLKPVKKREERNSMANRLRGATVILEAIGLSRPAAEPAPIDEAEIEAVLRSRGWVRKDEVEGEADGR